MALILPFGGKSPRVHNISMLPKLTKLINIQLRGNDIVEVPDLGDSSSVDADS